MKVLNTTKLNKRHTQYDISTPTSNFFVQVGGSAVLVHNSPAIFAGIDPTDGKFFVAKKGIFNKEPKVYKTPQEVAADTSGDLTNKLQAALKYLPSLGIKGVIQGDFLYSDDTIKRTTIDGVKYLTFHPNTIVYAVPEDSHLAKTILRSKIGIVWHTKYEGNTFEQMRAIFNQPIVDSLKTSPNVWSTGVVHKDVSGSATMTADETKQLSALFSQAGKLFNSIPANVLNGFSKDSELLTRVKTFDNSKIRDRTSVTDTARHVKDMQQWIYQYYQKHIDSKKTAASQLTWSNKRDEVLKFFTNNDPRAIARVYDLIGVLVQAKMMILKKLNQIKHLNTFLLTTNGFKVTGHEGFVVSDHLGGGGVKLVDRLTFSFANFSPEVLKGFSIRK